MVFRTYSSSAPGNVVVFSPSPAWQIIIPLLREKIQKRFMSIICKDSHKPTLPPPSSGLPGWMVNMIETLKSGKNEWARRSNKIPGKLTKLLHNERECWRGYQRGLLKLCQVTGFLGQCQVFDRSLSVSGWCDGERWPEKMAAGVDGPVGKGRW